MVQKDHSRPNQAQFPGASNDAFVRAPNPGSLVVTVVARARHQIPNPWTVAAIELWVENRSGSLT
jgi:hypothetical protein